MITTLDNYVDIPLENNTCSCTTKHVPDPRSLCAIDTPDGIVLLCPTGAANLTMLLREYDKVGGVPPGSVTKHYGKYIRDLARVVYTKN